MKSQSDIRPDTAGLAAGESAVPASSRIRKFVLGYIRLLLRMFYRRIEVAGLENIPSEGGGVLICWHPNGWIDGAVINTNFPYPLVAAGPAMVF